MDPSRSYPRNSSINHHVAFLRDVLYEQVYRADGFFVSSSFRHSFYDIYLGMVHDTLLYGRVTGYCNSLDSLDTFGTFFTFS